MFCGISNHATDYTVHDQQIRVAGTQLHFCCACVDALVSCARVQNCKLVGCGNPFFSTDKKNSKISPPPSDSSFSFLSFSLFLSLSFHVLFNVASQVRAPRPVHGPPLRLLTTITSPTKLNARPKENVTAQVVTALARRDTLVPLASAPSAPTLATDTERASLLPRLPMTFPTMLTMVPQLTSLPFQTATKTAITASVPRTQVPSTILHGMRLAPRVASVTLASVAPTAL